MVELLRRDPRTGTDSGNAADLGVEERCRIVAGAVETLLRDHPAHLGGPYDLVLADPPYETPAGDSLLAALEAPGLLRPAARVVLQRDRRAPGPDPPSRPGGLIRVRTAVYGRNCLDFYRFPPPSSE